MKKRNSPKKEEINKYWRLLGGIIWLIIGAVLGLFVPRLVVSCLPGPKVQAVLRGEQVPGIQGMPDCSFYLMRVVNFGVLDYFSTTIQFSHPITDFKIGEYEEYDLNSEGHKGKLAWQKGWNDSGSCAILSNTLMKNPYVIASSNGGILQISSISKIPLGTPLVALIATTDSGPLFKAQSASGIWTDGDYEFTSLGQSVRKKLPFIVTLPRR